MKEGTRTMPKMKTKGGVKKRFRLTGSGKIKRRRAMHSHILTKKNSKRKRHATSPHLVDPADEKRIKKLISG
jgi:large subunit ribosomal protein L35